MDQPASPFSIRLTATERKVLTAAAVQDLPEWRRRYISAARPGRILGPWIVKAALEVAASRKKTPKKVDA